jgi:hypothetical protein
VAGGVSVQRELCISEMRRTAQCWVGWEVGREVRGKCKGEERERKREVRVES